MWGDVPTWVGSFGTLAAFFPALFLYRSSVMDQRRAQARLLSPLGLPDRFASLAHARQFLDEFVHAYNHHHRHTGIGLHTPADVHYGLADAIDRDRDAALASARRAHPERFSAHGPARPKILDRDPGAWIDQPPADELQPAT